MSAPSDDRTGVTPPPPPPANDPLQFDKVEYTGAEAGADTTVATCASCQSPIADSYYEVNGQIVCPRCKMQIHGAVTGGSKTARMVKAFVFGVVAAVISSIGYYYLCKLTEREFAIATIAMGWFIGWAVHRGAEGRGGWFYITAAVVLTYASISFSYVPMIFEAASEQVDVSDQVADSSSFATTETSSVPVEEQPELSTEAAQAAATDVVTDAAADTGDAVPETSAAFILSALIFVLSIPIMSGMQSPIMILIYGFGLWQAGKMNRRPHINVTGPYSTRGGMATAHASGPIPDNKVL